jgi:hypothetical protein
MMIDDGDDDNDDDDDVDDKEKDDDNLDGRGLCLIRSLTSELVLLQQ